MPAKRKASSPKDSTANFGFEGKLWLAADKLRNNMAGFDFGHLRATLVILANGSMSYNQSGDGEIRCTLIEAAPRWQVSSSIAA